MKPPIITLIEQQTGRILTEATDLQHPSDIMLHAYQSQYVANENQLLGLNLCGASQKKLGIEQLKFLANEELRTLRYLNLSENELSSFTVTANISQLAHLSMSENPSLQELDISIATQLERLEAFESGLTQLKLPTEAEKLAWVDLRNNKLERFEWNAKAPGLVYLDISHNQLQTCQLKSNFSSLTYLYLNDNQLGSFECDTQLDSLQILHLRKNKLTHLREFLIGQNFPAMESLYLGFNPDIDIPREHISESEYRAVNAWSKVRDYIGSLKADQGGVENDEVKLIVLGNSTSGKSTLIHYLTEGSYDDSLSSTHGIENIIWEVEDKNYSVNVWDFGGQEFYHATHRLFISDNALTLILFEEKTNQYGEIPTLIRLQGKEEKKEVGLEHFPLAYWLEGLAYFRQDEEKEKLKMALVAQSKMDISDWVDLDQTSKKKFQLNEEQNVFRLSVKEAAKGSRKYLPKFEEFNEILLQKLGEIRATYPISSKWLKLKQEIRRMAENSAQAWLAWEKYVSLCESFLPELQGMEEDERESMLQTLTNYLHEIGVILCYRFSKSKNEERAFSALKEKVFINPKWVVNSIYAILNYEVIDDYGKFTLDHVNKCTGAGQAQMFLELMEEFELIFPAKNDENTYVAPQYLPPKEIFEKEKGFKKQLNKCDAFLFSIHYPTFLPRSVMTRFICKYGKLSDDYYWKEGVEFQLGEVPVLASSNGKDTITIMGSEDTEEVCVELFHTLTALSDNDLISFSTDGEHYVQLREWKNRQADQAEVRTTAGKYIKLSDFSRFIREEGNLAHDEMGSRDIMPAEGGMFGEKLQGSFWDIEDKLHLTIQEKLKILFLSANPKETQSLQLGAEFSNINGELKKGSMRDSYELMIPETSVTFYELQRAMMKDPAIVHFAGHGKKEGIMIAKEDNTMDFLSKEDLIGIFRPMKGIVQLVVLNACYSADQAKSISEMEMLVIGTSRAIQDEAAVEFAKGLYRGLSEKRDLKRVIDTASVSLKRKYKDQHDIIRVWKDGKAYSI
ncbi:MAG: COR domain-containing protein [Bacteroidota bacterium]